VAGQTKNFSAVSTLEAWDTAGNVLDVHINPNQGQAQYELNIDGDVIWFNLHKIHSCWRRKINSYIILTWFYTRCINISP
ncbi:YbbR family protein, partial [human gut metagenome]